MKFAPAVVACIFIAANIEAQDWPTYRADNARTGIAWESIDCARLKLAWSWQAPEPPHTAWDGPARWDAYNKIHDLPAMRQYDACFHPVSDGQRVYFGSSSQDTLFALNIGDGKLRWSYIANGPIRLAPTLYDGRVYFGCDDGYVYCVAGETGQLKWKFSPSVHDKADPRRVISNDRLISFYPIRTGITIEDGLAYFAASFLPWRESYICAVDAETGEVDGSANAFVEKHEKATLEGSLLVANDRIIVPQGRVAPLVFDRTNGKKIGSLPGGGGVTIVLTNRGEIVRTEGGGAARPGQVGVFRDKERVASFPRGRSIVVDTDRYYVVDGKKVFAALREGNVLKWQATLKEPLELIKTGNHILVGGRDQVTALDAETGKVNWRATIRGRAFGLAVAGGHLIVSTDSGHMFAFSPTADQAWVNTDNPSGNESVAWVSPPVQPLVSDDLLHRWVFHRSAMTAGPNEKVEGTELNDVVVADQSGKANIRLKGTANAVKIGPSETSINFEAIEPDHAYFPVDENLAAKLPDSAISAETWVRVDEPKTWGGIVGCLQDDGSTEHGWLLGYRDNKFSFAIAGSQSGLTYLTAPAGFQSGSWNHVVGTFDQAEMRLYVNGALVATSDAESGPISYADKRIFTVGAYRDANELFPVNGAIHEVRIYSSALDAERIAQLYADKASEFPSPEQVAESSPPQNLLAWGPIARYLRPGAVEIRYGTDTKCPTIVDLMNDADISRFSIEELADVHRIVVDGLPHRRQVDFQILETDSDDSIVLGKFALDTHFDWSRVGRPDGGEPWINEVINKSPNLRGLALVIGESFADKAKQLAKHSQWSVVLIVENDQQANEVRDRWVADPEVTKADLHYGKKLSVLPAALSQLPAAFASVVIAQTEDQHAARLVRPAGGILHDTQQVQWQRKPLADSGVWTHMYGQADNSAFGGESLAGVSSRQDLLTQWIGKPGPRYKADRGNRRPSPLAAGGRLYLQGQQRLIALDNFNGSVLWSLETPTVMRFNVPHDCSNWCADQQGVYVAAKNQAWFIDGKTGHIERQFDVPEMESMPQPTSWGYIARYKNQLIGTAVARGASFTDWWGAQHWYDSTGGPDTHVVAGDLLFALDKKTGDTVWKFDGLVLHPTITILDDRIYFVEDITPQHAKDSNRRIAIEKDQQHRLVCLDLSDGNLLWQRPLAPFGGHVASLYLAGGGDDEHRSLVMVASESTQSQFVVHTFDPESGQPGWNRSVKWESNHHGKHISRPAIQGELLYLRPEVLNLSSGQTITRGFPGGHGCSSYTLSTRGLFTRLGETTWWDVRNQQVHRFDRIRTDCWISIVPAQGMLLSAEGGGGCSCGNWLETSIGFLPRSVDESLPDK